MARAAVAAVAVAVLGAEATHALVARSWPARLVRGRSTGLIVLGCPTSRHGRLSASQRWRVDIARRSLAAVGSASSVRVVFTGAAWKNGRAEAAAMAGHARELGMPEESIVVEDGSHTTWENIAFSLPLLEDVEQLAVVSDPLHAARGRRYLLAQRPELAGRLARADDYLAFERLPLKVASLAYEVPRVAWLRRRWLTRGR